MRLGTSTLRFAFEWEPGEDVAGPELAATWARLEVWVGPECITRVEDTASESSRRGIYCSLYPLAEWIAFNWSFLKGHLRAAEYLVGISAAGSANGPAAASWMPHHNVRWSGDGYAWPDLFVLPEGPSTRLLWRPDGDSTASRPIRYLTGGDWLVDPDPLELSLAHLIESVLARLDESGVENTPLAEEWSAIAATDAEESAFALAAARLGADPYDIDANLAAIIERAATRLEGNLLDDFVSSVNPHRIDAGLDWMAQAGEHLDGMSGEPHEALTQIRGHTKDWRPSGRGLPWAVGWNQAQLLRKVLELSPAEAFGFTEIFTVEELPSGDRGLEGLGGTTRSGVSGIVLGRHLGDSGRRFATARALWHFAYEGSVSPFLLSGLHTGRERVERAFAAELLAPATGIADLVSDETGLVTNEDVEEAAEHYGVSPLLVRHQINNQLAVDVL